MTDQADRPDRGIVVGIDASEASTKALRWGAAEAVRRGRPLTVVHAGYYLYEPALRRSRAESEAREIGEYAGGIIDAARRVVDEVDPTIEMTPLLHEGSPSEYLITVSADADLIVLGSHGDGSLAGAVLGSISQSVAAHAHCPVVVINLHSPAHATPRPVIVVGVSPSRAGIQALRFAFSEAALRAAALVTVRCWGDVEWGAASIGYDSSVIADWEKVEQRVLDECVDNLAPEFPSVPVYKELKRIRPQWGLDRLAIGAELLVVGCHRPDDHWFSRLGPVASWLVHRAPCPVAVVGDSSRDRVAGQPE